MTIIFFWLNRKFNLMMNSSLFIPLLFLTIILLFGNAFARTEKMTHANASDLSYFPCVVQVVTTRLAHVCGGCLLDDENVLTSARCLGNFSNQNNSTELLVRGGDVILKNSTQPSFQKRSVRKFIVHPSYNEQSMENDIALLKISRPFMPSVNIHEVQRGQERAYGRCFLPGWTDEKGIAARLHYITVYTTTAEKCQPVVKNTICTINRIEAGGCEGDYGGPLICGKKVYGVFIGPKTACDGKPGLFTDLSRFDDWLESNIHEEEYLKPSGRYSRSFGTPSMVDSRWRLIIASAIIIVHLEIVWIVESKHIV